MIQEINRDVSSGYVALLALLVATGVAIFALVRGIQGESVVQVIVWSVALLFIFVGYAGFFMVNPNEARILGILRPKSSR